MMIQIGCAECTRRHHATARELSRSAAVGPQAVLPRQHGAIVGAGFEASGRVETTDNTQLFSDSPLSAKIQVPQGSAHVLPWYSKGAPHALIQSSIRGLCTFFGKLSVRAFPPVATGPCRACALRRPRVVCRTPGAVRHDCWLGIRVGNASRSRRPWPTLASR